MKQVMHDTSADYHPSRVIGRPDGFYWRDSGSGKLFWPFATLLDAVNDMTYDPEAGPEPGETLEEAESEVGMAGWIDPDTGAPAEEEVPRVEEH